MRFSKDDILRAFEREDRSYRLALLATYWLRDIKQYKPSARDEAMGLKMGARAEWISFEDLALLLDDHQARERVVSEFFLSQLHALIRSPFELLADYCEDYDAAIPGAGLRERFQAQDWNLFARLIRNAISHNFHFEFSERDLKKLPVSWNGIELKPNLQGKPVTHEALWHKTGYELFLQMRDFAISMPEP